eukprot:sb/3476656/
MDVHCVVVYEVGLEMFGLVEVKKGGRKEPFRSRRCMLIESLVAEGRVVKVERKVGWEGKVREIASQLSKLRNAERRREKERERKRQRGLFKRGPFKAVKEILEPSPVGELRCSKD